jgi:hypothetical protein
MLERRWSVETDASALSGMGDLKARGVQAKPWSDLPCLFWSVQVIAEDWVAKLLQVHA